MASGSMFATHTPATAAMITARSTTPASSRLGQRRGASATARGRTGVWGGRVRTFTACTLPTCPNARYPLHGLPLCEGRSVRVVRKVRPQPTFRFEHALAEPPGVILDLILADLPHVEIPRLGVLEVQAAHARGGQHRTVLGEIHAEVACLEQIERPPLQRMIGARRIPERRPD